MELASHQSADKERCDHEIQNRSETDGRDAYGNIEVACLVLHVQVILQRLERERDADQGIPGRSAEHHWLQQRAEYADRRRAQHTRAEQWSYDQQQSAGEEEWVGEKRQRLEGIRPEERDLGSNESN